MSDSVRPHRQQPTRLPRPWDSPGKNTGVGCHFLLQCMKVKSESEVVQLCLTLRDPVDCSLPGSSIMGFPGKSTGVGCHCLLCPSWLGTSKLKEQDINYLGPHSWQKKMQNLSGETLLQPRVHKISIVKSTLKFTTQN